MPDPAISAETVERRVLRNERVRLYLQQDDLQSELRRLLTTHDGEGMTVHHELLRAHSKQLAVFTTALHAFHERYGPLG